MKKLYEITSDMSFEERLRLASENTVANKNNVSECVEIIKSLTDISLEDIQSRKRFREIAFARHLLHYALRSKTNLGLEEIGGITERDHSTVIHSINYIEDCSQTDAYIWILKKAVDDEKLPEFFMKTKNLLKMSLKRNRSHVTRAEGVYSIIFKHLDLLKSDDVESFKKKRKKSRERRSESMLREVFL